MTSSEDMIERVALIFARSADNFLNAHASEPSDAAWEDFSPREQLMAKAAARAAIEATAPLVERAFKDGLAYAGNVHNPDPELSWQQSRVRASLQGDER